MMRPELAEVPKKRVEQMRLEAEQQQLPAIAGALAAKGIDLGSEVISSYVEIVSDADEIQVGGSRVCFQPRVNLKSDPPEGMTKDDLVTALTDAMEGMTSTGVFDDIHWVPITGTDIYVGMCFGELVSHERIVKLRAQAAQAGRT